MRLFLLLPLLLLLLLLLLWYEAHKSETWMSDDYLLSAFCKKGQFCFTGIGMKINPKLY
jgi:hypothetical protein